MRFLVSIGLFILFLSGEGISYGQTSVRLQDTLETLNRVPAGGGLLAKALRIWKLPGISSLLENLKWGQASRTDTVLTRHYNPKTGQEDRERRVTIFLREDQPEADLILDLAHELVHATARPTFDPYDSALTPGKYIIAALEGEGGEVDAVITECTVAIELAEQLGSPLSRCRNYLDSSEVKGSGPAYRVNKDKVRSDFYRVGKWQADLLRRLGEEIRLFPLISTDSPRLYSSTGHAPYPIALLNEFEEITEMACDNSRKRMNSVASRSPASTFFGPSSGSTLHSDRESIQLFIQKRCK